MEPSVPVSFNRTAVKAYVEVAEESRDIHYVLLEEIVESNHVWLLAEEDVIR